MIVTLIIIGINKKVENNIRELYLNVKQTGKIVEIRYSIQEDDYMKIILPDESKFTYIENLILNEVIKVIKELKIVCSKVAINIK